MTGSLPIHWGKRCYTHTASVSQIPDSQGRLQSEGGEGKVTRHTDEPSSAIERWEGDLKDALLSNFHK